VTHVAYLVDPYWLRAVRSRAATALLLLGVGACHDGPISSPSCIRYRASRPTLHSDPIRSYIIPLFGLAAVLGLELSNFDAAGPDDSEGLHEGGRARGGAPRRAPGGPPINVRCSGKSVRRLPRTGRCDRVKRYTVRPYLRTKISIYITSSRCYSCTVLGTSREEVGGGRSEGMPWDRRDRPICGSPPLKTLANMRLGWGNRPMG
jgi:hypothetical protein